MVYPLVPAPLFLSARPEHPRPQAQIIGFPYEATASFRGGAAFAPNAIRTFSESIETYSPHQDRDLEDLILVDRGNVLLEEPVRWASQGLEDLRTHMARLKAQAVFTLFLGGEHTSTLAFLSPKEVQDPHFFLLVLDAHLDLREVYQGTAYSHASWARRALEALGPSRMLIAGARSGTREEFHLARERGLWVPTADALIERLAQLPPGTRIHLSLDIDVLDPAHAPGTGNPEPLGWSVAEVLRVLQALKRHRVVSADLVEYSPPHDPSGRTGVLAAFLVREMLLALTPGVP